MLDEGERHRVDGAPGARRAAGVTPRTPLPRPARHAAPVPADERLRQQEGQQQQRLAPTGRAAAEPPRRVVLLDRSLPRAGRGHRTPARGALPAARSRTARCPTTSPAAVVLDALSLPHGVVRRRPGSCGRCWVTSRTRRRSSAPLGAHARTRARCATRCPATSSRRSTAPTSRCSRGLTTAASPGASMHRVLERLMVVNGAHRVDDAARRGPLLPRRSVARWSAST